MDNLLKDRIFNINDPEEFNLLALEIFNYQAVSNKIYRDYLKILKIDPTAVKTSEKIPFIPIELFKTSNIITGDTKPELKFESSGTTGSVKSMHLIVDPELYVNSFTKCFSLFYGSPNKYCILALLPSYFEFKNSSLVYMVDGLIRTSKNKYSGFYLDNLTQLADTLKITESMEQPVILLGVSFALLQFAQKFPLHLKHTIIMETGGMKGRHEEITREELHGILKEAFHVNEIHSEYGMTELLSQAYSKGHGLFQMPPWMRIMIRDTYDPMTYMPDGKSGGINVIDLANIYSCSFISTQDIGKILPTGGFEVLGRFDDSDLRGCNLMME
jgi:phenylacetate-coenzyme A ligase PaaK-like adenylate-forming protein